MAQSTLSRPESWEKPHDTEHSTPAQGINWKFMIGGLILLAGVAFLIISGTTSGARYFITVDELLAGGYTGQTVRISGAVIGETIEYDAENLIIDFTIAHVPDDGGDLAKALYEAVHNPNAARLKVHIENQVKPDLLTNEAQAILTGKLGPDGVFVASELLLKCPSRYGETDPAKAIAEPGK